MKKKILFVMRSPPHSQLTAQEALDAILISAAFDQTVSLLFLDDAVFQLKKTQDPEVLGLKNIAPCYQALEIYDVTQVLVEQESLLARGLDQDDLILPVQIVPANELAALSEAQDIIFNY